MQQSDSMLAWALAYARLGWKVFPLRTSGDLKAPHPCLGKTGGHLKGTTDRATIRAWWRAHPKAGIGVWCAGSGLIVVDVDLKGNGPRALAELEAVHGRLRSPVEAVSGSGGRHIVLAAPNGLAGVPGKLAGHHSIDLKWNGYIVLAPSPHCAGSPPAPTGKNYAWKKGCDPFEGSPLMPLVPSWVLQRAPGTGNALAVGADSPVADLGDEVTKAGLSLDQIRELLEWVPNTDLDYDDWLNVLAGVWHETDGSDEAEEIVREWSASSLKHVDSKFNKSWRSLDHRNSGVTPISIRFLIKRAGEAKREASKESFAELKAAITDCRDLDGIMSVCQTIKHTELDSLRRNELAAAVKAQHKLVTGNTLNASTAARMVRFEDDGKITPTWLAQWVYVTAEDRFVMRGTDLAVTKQAFDNTFNCHMLTSQEKREGKSYPEQTASNAALNTFEIPRAKRRMYMPSEADVFSIDGVTYFNTFSESSQPAVPANPSLVELAAMRRVESHFQHMIPNDRDRSIVLSWLAHIVQTQERPNWSIVIQSPEGEGKSFMAELMAIVLGQANVKILDTKVIQGNFTGWAAGHLLKIIEEIKLHGLARFEILDNIKSFITNSMINVHAKNKEPVDVVNTAAYLMFTNYRDALPLGSGDTRYFLVASPRQTIEEVEAFKRENPEYFGDLYDAMRSYPGAMRKLFLNYRLSPEFNAKARAPWSREKSYIQSLNKSDSQNAIEEIIAENLGADLSDWLFDTTRFQQHLTETGADYVPAGKGLANLLSSMGFTKLGRFKIGEQKKTYWSKKPSVFGEPGSTDCGIRIRAYLAADI